MKHILISLSFIVLVTSCEDFLNTEPSDFLSSSNYYNTEKDLKAALAGLYYRLTFYNGTGLYMYGDDADIGYYRTTSLAGPWTYDFDATNGYISNKIFPGLTGAVRDANFLLAYMDKNTEIDQAVRDSIRGEALFFRGYYHFLLVQRFGEISLILEPVTSPYDVHIPRSPIKDCYDQILKDMTGAEQLVPDIQDLGFGGKLSKSAVRGMLARVCLYMAGEPLNDTGKYKEARDWAKKVIDEGYHELNPKFSDIFINYAADKYDPKESIWEVEYWGNNSGDYTQAGSVGAVNGAPSNNTATGLAGAGVYPTTFLWNLYREGDLRRDWSISNFNYTATGPCGSKTFKASGTSAHVKSSAKWRREYEVVERLGRITPQNFPLLRYSDVLLMFAEADTEVNGVPGQAAIDAINEVRRRAWSTGVKSITVTNGGSGYTSVPKVSFSGGGGSGALATAQVSEGEVTAITLDLDAVTGYAYGEDYTSAPTVIISGGEGSGATATAQIFTKEEAELHPIQTSTKDIFMIALKQERAKELCFELTRKYDLIRWGDFVTNMNRRGAEFSSFTGTADILQAQWFKNVSEKHTVFPIPERELMYNKAAKQTPGWE